MTLAIKYRPVSFGEVIGQEFAVKSVKGMLESGGMPATVLLSGPHSTGKTTLARLIAMSACCESASGGEACGECDNCGIMLKAIKGGPAHPDVAEINAASDRGIDMMRGLKREARFVPTRGPYRIFILDEAHAITKEAFQAALKLFEEPPRRTRFIMCTTNPEKLPETIRSRCQKFPLRPIRIGDCARLLARVCKRERYKAANKKLVRDIATTVHGHPRDALNVLEQVMNYVKAAGKGADLSEALPKVLEESAIDAPYIAVQKYLQGVLGGKYGLALLAARNAQNHDFFVGRVIESLQQVMYHWVNPDVLPDGDKSWLLNGLTKYLDQATGRPLLGDMATILDIFLSTHERMKTYLVEPSAALDAATLKVVSLTQAWRSDGAPAGTRKKRGTTRKRSRKRP